jgi:hypothetical protein
MGKDPGVRLGSIADRRRNWNAAKAERRYYEALYKARGKCERQPPQKIGGGGSTRGDWRSQVGDLSQLPVLTVGSG